jgi:DNA-binding response OmpR family regulator
VKGAAKIRVQWVLYNPRWYTIAKQAGIVGCRVVQPGGAMKILVIDDNPAFRSSLARTLGKGGYQVVMADDGEQGLAMFRVENPDLVICDLIMPRRSGVDTIQQIRRESPAMKIIAISGSGTMMNVDGLATAFESGADDVIVKPFDSEDLLSRVTQVFGI